MGSPLCPASSSWRVDVQTASNHSGSIVWVVWLWLLIIQASTSGLPLPPPPETHIHTHVHTPSHTNFKWPLATIIALIDGQSNRFQSLCSSPCKMQGHVSMQRVVLYCALCMPHSVCVSLCVCGICVTIYSYSLVSVSLKCDVEVAGQTMQLQAAEEGGLYFIIAIKWAVLRANNE